MRHANPQTSRRGFTLIELLVVMTILVILVLIALPVFNYITASRSTESGINLAGAMLGRARALALSRTDNKYIGVLFYHQVDDDRDAMQIVEVDAEDPGSGLERYFGWQNTVAYRPLDNTLTPPHPADVVYSVALDTSLGGTTFGGGFNSRPVVKRYVKKTYSSAGDKPPNGPPFTNGSWDTRLVGNTIPVVLDAEVQYLPLGVRAKVLKRRGSSNVASPALILFDKQGRVTQKRWGIARDEDASKDGGEKLLDAMGITNDLPISDERTSGIGLAVFNVSDIERSGASVDVKNETAVNKWVLDNVDQYTVGTQSGELIGAAQQ